MNAIPVGSRTAFRWEGEHPSGRSDAGSTIVQEVFDFVKCWDGEKDSPERSGGRRPQAEKGVRGKGRSPLPRRSTVEIRSALLAVRLIARLAHGFTEHFDAMSIVHNAVENAVGQGWIADLLMPLVDGQLRSKNQR